jgi:hypothetical protein
VTRYFYDTEFIEDGRTIGLVSIGISAEGGREYYAVCADADWQRVAASAWLCDNVVPHLPLLGPVLRPEEGIREGYRFRIDTHDPVVKPRHVIAREVRDFLLADGPPDLWAYYGAYDHVVLSWLWGPMIRRPEGIPMFTHDVMQYAASLGYPDLPRQAGAEHNALADARHTRAMWLHLDALAADPYFRDHDARFHHGGPCDRQCPPAWLGLERRAARP